MTEELYLLQTSSPIRIGSLRQQFEIYSKQNTTGSSLELLSKSYLGIYHKILLSGELDMELVNKNRLLKYLFNRSKVKNAKNINFSLQKLTASEKQKVLSGQISKPKINWKEGDLLQFPLGTKFGEGTILSMIDENTAIISFSAGGKNKIKIDLQTCLKK